MSKTPSTYRFWGLDLLRALAILLVMLTHASFFPYDWSGVDQYFHWFGLLGVELFFALSGFLIGRILLKVFMQDFTFGQLRYFWIRRWLRTLPNYYFILAINFLLLLSIGGFSLQHLEYVGFIQNFSSPHPIFFREAWSLSIEEWFYLLIPLCLFLVAFLAKNKSKKILFRNSLILILISLLIFRYNHILSSPNLNVDSGLRQIVIYRLDAPIWGVLAAWVYHFHPNWWKNYAKGLFIGGCLLLSTGIVSWYSSNSLAQAFIFPFIDLGFVLWLPWAAQWRAPQNWLGKAIHHTSLISYSLYLIHMQIIFRLVLRLTNWLNWWQIWIVYFILSFLIASIIYKYIEQPILHWRDRRFKNPEK
ncbi:MAG: acyltransferase [Aureispira sp.]|nr:acyltransferase [Aureispira sp.]